MHVITNRPGGPVRHSSFLPGFQVTLSPPPLTFLCPTTLSIPPFALNPFPSDPVPPLLSPRSLFPPPFCLSCVPLLLNQGGEREEMSHYFKDTVALAANPLTA